MKNDNIVLIQRILAGDATAFAHLIRKYQKQVHTLAWRKIGDFHIAEDITQETFLQVYQKLETLEDPTRFPRWLYVIAERLCIAWIRRNQQQTEPLEDTSISEIETEAYSRYIATEHAKTFAEARRDLVEKLLAKLKEGNRRVITLHYLEGMTYAEISNFLGVPENTIRSRLLRARQQLKKYEFMIQEALDITIEGEHRSQRFGDIVKESSTEKSVDLAMTADDHIEITCGDGVYNTVELPDEEFPKLPSVGTEAHTIAGKNLRSVLHKTKFAASTEAVQSYRNWLYFNFLEDRTEVVATDGIQLALAHCEPLKLSEDSDGFLVPLKAVKEIERIFSNSVEVRISRVENEILFADGHTRLTTQLVNAEYPEYDRAIPKSFVGRVVVPKASIVHATHKILSQANPKNSRVCLEVDAQQLRISAKTSETDEIHETLAVESDTESVRIGMNAQILIETLTHIETQSVSLEFSSALDPVIVKPIGEEGHLCFIMPMCLET